MTINEIVVYWLEKKEMLEKYKKIGEEYFETCLTSCV